MKIRLVVKGWKGLEEVAEVIEKDIYVGCGVQFLLHGTRYMAAGKIEEIDEDGRRIFVTAPEFNEWIGFEAVRDVISADDLANFKLQNQIDYAIDS